MMEYACSMPVNCCGSGALYAMRALLSGIG
jgi:hypothetical protein